MYLYIILFLLVLGAFYIAIKFGESMSDKHHAERVAKDAEKDSEIDADPNVDNPLDRM